MLLETSQVLEPVLPPMARARTRYVLVGVRLGITIQKALRETTASSHVRPFSVLTCT